VRDTEIHLGELEHLVLLAILRLGEEAYAVSGLDLLADRAGRKVARGALYTVLDRLETKGLLCSRFGDSLPERGGRPRRYFSVTSSGLAALRRSRRALNRLTHGLDALLEEP